MGAPTASWLATHARRGHPSLSEIASAPKEGRHPVVDDRGNTHAPLEPLSGFQTVPTPVPKPSG